MDDNALNRLANRYPSLDLQCLRILWLISEWKGATMADIADELGTDHRYVQFHVSMLAAGKSGREKHGLNLILVEPDLFDKRRKNLTLTERGERVIKALWPLTKN